MENKKMSIELTLEEWDQLTEYLLKYMEIKEIMDKKAPKKASELLEILEKQLPQEFHDKYYYGEDEEDETRV